MTGVQFALVGGVLGALAALLVVEKPGPGMSTWRYTDIER